ncbi:MAG: response regulator [Bdellovibrionota bacterium]
MSLSKKILVVDDEKDIGELLVYSLQQEGCDVDVIQDGQQVLGRLQTKTYDLVILDLMLPGMSGIEICRQIKKDPELESLPVIMLTAKSTETDKIVGLEMGADDYITKPFSPREVVARVKAVLRRSEDRQPLRSSQKEIVFETLKMDLSRYEVFVEDVEVKLTNTEFKILQCLIEKPGHVFNRSQLIDFALGKDVSVVDRTIDVHITNLRKKLGAIGSQIESIRGVGYRIKESRS